MTERTLVLLKPDAVQRGLVGRITARLEDRGLEIIALKLMQMDMPLARRHYAEHVQKPFFPEVAAFITSAPLVAMVVQGPNAVDVVRAAMGATNPRDAAPGSIRGDLALDIAKNLIHGSDSPEAADREIPIFFTPPELHDYERAISPWIH